MENDTWALSILNPSKLSGAIDHGVERLQDVLDILEEIDTACEEEDFVEGDLAKLGEACEAFNEAMQLLTVEGINLGGLREVLRTRIHGPRQPPNGGKQDVKS